jgi:hypothetical protein
MRIADLQSIFSLWRKIYLAACLLRFLHFMIPVADNRLRKLKHLKFANTVRRKSMKFRFRILFTLVATLP